MSDETIRMERSGGRRGGISARRDISAGRDLAGRDLYQGPVNQYIYALAKEKRAPYQPPAPPGLGQLPEVGPLPPGSRIPHLRNAVFTGRERQLLDLAEGLLCQSADSCVVGVVQTTAALGMGGMGKSQLAVEFCWRYGRFFHGVHWIQGKVAASDDDILGEIAACGAEMEIDPWPKEAGEQARLTLQIWAETGPRLVVLDNFEEVELLQRWLPRLKGSRILLTARRGLWPRSLGITEYSLGLFQPAESLILLRRLAERLEGVPNTALLELVEFLGHLPLAIDLAGNYLNDRDGLGVQEYVHILKQAENALEHSSLKDWTRENATQHDTSLAATFLLSWEQLGEGEADARRVFRACGYLAPNVAIPTGILSGILDGENTGERRDACLKRLFELGLLTREQAGPVNHPMLAAFARQVDRDSGASELARVVSVVSDLGDQANEAGLPHELRSYYEHLQVLAEWAKKEDLENLADLYNLTGIYLQQIAHFSAARAAYETALKLVEQRYGLEHAKVAVYAHNLGSILHDLGEKEAARALYERALCIDEREYGPEHPDVARDLNSLGSILEDLGENEAARSILDRALRIHEAELGEDHPDVASVLNTLGSVLRKMDEPDRALEAFQRAIKINEAAYGRENPVVAGDLNSIGILHWEQDQLDQARAALERALVIDEAVYGPDHPTVVNIAGNLALVLVEQDELERAHQLFERALQVDQQVYGPDHPKIAIDLVNLGSLLQKEKNLTGAKAVFERALKIDEAAHGPHSLDVAIDLAYLGSVLKEMEELQAARACLERTVSIKEAHYGTHDPRIVPDLQELGEVLRSLGDLEGAKAIYEHVLELDAREYGAETEVTANDLENLGSVLEEMEELEEAKAVYERMLRMDEDLYGPQHAIIAADLNRLGGLLVEMDDLEGSRAAYERALIIDEAVESPDHLHIAMDLDNLGIVLVELGELEAARAAFERALRIFEQIYPAGHPDIEATRESLEDVLWALGEK